MSHTSGVTSSEGVWVLIPALFTRMVGRPKPSLAASNAAVICARSVTSQTRQAARPPCSLTAATVARALVSSTSSTLTLAPTWASVRAIARPRPPPPPVTIACWPVRSIRLWCRAGAVIDPYYVPRFENCQQLIIDTELPADSTAQARRTGRGEGVFDFGHAGDVDVPGDRLLQLRGGGCELDDLLCRVA